VSKFYLLPPRPLLGEQFSAFLGHLFPGLNWDAEHRSELTEMLGAAAASHPDVFVIYREELADDDPQRALCDGFGAEAGDEVIEVRVGSRPGELTARRWEVSARSAH
jgi:hypothetical protein